MLIILNFMNIFKQAPWLDRNEHIFKYSIKKQHSLGASMQTTRHIKFHALNSVLLAMLCVI